MKKVLSLAIAAALVAPAAAMADATLFGKAHFIVQSFDNDASNVDEWSVDSVHSRVGVKGAEDLGNGLKAVYHFEFKVEQDQVDSSGNDVDGLGDRNQFIGLAGGFGTFLLGRHDTPLKMSQGTFDQFGDLPNGDITSIIPGEDRVDNVTAYVSPAMGGFTFVGALVAGESGDTAQLLNATTELTGIADHYSLAGLYSNGPIFASLAYNKYDLGSQGGGATPNLIRATFIWNGGSWQVGGMYSTMDLDTGEAIGETDAYGVSGFVKVGGAGKVKAQYLMGDSKKAAANNHPAVSGFYPNVSVGYGNDEATQWSIGYEHALSSRTTVHAGYTALETDSKSTDQTALFGGIIHNF